jgi:predicted nucleotidyltransferase
MLTREMGIATLRRHPVPSRQTEADWNYDDPRKGRPRLGLVQCVAISNALSGSGIVRGMSSTRVVKVLNDAGVRFVLVGAHGIAGWLQKPRATQDVDVIVAARHHGKAVAILLDAFPGLEPEDTPVVTRLRRRKTAQVVIDVMKPREQLIREALKQTETIKLRGEVVKIPSLEMALALKFAPMVSPNRMEIKKYQDAHDFGQMVLVNSEIDVSKLSRFAEMVCSGGGMEVQEMIRQIRAGERLIF